MFFKRQNDGEKFLNEADKIVENYAEEKAMEEKRITREEFDNAVIEVIVDMVNEEVLEGTAKLIVPMTGSMFASKMRRILFGENQEEK